MLTSQDHAPLLERDQARPASLRRRRLGVALGAAAAGLASAGLVYWIGSGEDRTLSSAHGVSAPPARTTYASARPNADQVVGAYDQLQEIYADKGVSGVIGFARACANTVRADPGVLDFCIAFDIYAGALDSEDAAARAWQAQAEARDLALARGVLPPGQDAAARLAEIHALARTASLETPLASEPKAPSATGASSPPVGAPAPPARTAAVQGGGATHERPSSAAEACLRRGPAAQRTVCASPALREADRRMRIVYRRALAAGASPHRLARDQARFHAAVKAAAPNRTVIARLYYRRTHALEVLVRRLEGPVD